MWDSLPSQWANHLSAYPNSIKTRELSENKSDLVSLDNFIWSELGAQVHSASRAHPHITAAEYVRIVRWKLKRGKWRPRLQSMADALDDAQVVAASTKAFATLKMGKLRDALKPLVELRGCGPATASAILGAVDEQVPFMSDELLQEATGERKYTMSAYMQLVQKVKQKTEELSAEDSNRSWTARDVEKAVFAAHHIQEDPIDPADRPSYRSQAKAANTKSKDTSHTKSIPAGESGTKEIAAGKKQVNSRTTSGKSEHKATARKKEKRDLVEGDSPEGTATGRKQVNSRTRSERASEDAITDKKGRNTRTRSGKTHENTNAETTEEVFELSSGKDSTATIVKKKEESPHTRSSRTRGDSSKRAAAEMEKPRARKRVRSTTKDEDEAAKPSISDEKTKKSAEVNVRTTQRLTRSSSIATKPDAKNVAIPRRSTRVKAPTGG